MEGVKLDKWGYEVKTSSDACISAINSYYHQVLSYGRERKVIVQATLHDKDCVLANILAADFLSSYHPWRASLHLQAAKSRLDQASSYDKSVFDAISSLFIENTDVDFAVEIHCKLLNEYPKDLVSLKRAQGLCFYMARPDLSLNLVQQVLPENQKEDYVYGMLAFPLLELGQMVEAEEAARTGYEINKNDYWSQHAVCHVLQYAFRFKEAVDFMEQCSSSWAPCLSFMLTHNWWHVALCLLEGNASKEKVLDIYDHHIWKELEKIDATPAEVYLNALGLLLRVHVHGRLDVFDDRLKVLAERLTDKAGHPSKADDLVKGLKSRWSKMNRKNQQVMHKGLLLAESICEYGKGNNQKALELLDPYFDAVDYKIIGASDEQADVFNEVWYDMLLDAGQATKAIEVIEERIKKREGTPFMWRLLRSYRMTEKLHEANVAGEKARALEASYF